MSSLFGFVARISAAVFMVRPLISVLAGILGISAGGPIAGGIFAALQSNIGMNRVMAFVQSAAMGGYALAKLKAIIAGLGIGVAGLAGR